MQVNFTIFQVAMDESPEICSTSQLLVFIRGVDEDMNITQELASLHSMHGTVTGEDIFNELQKTSADYNLDWTNLSCLTVDGGKNMKGIKKGLVGQVKQMCNEKTFHNQYSCTVLFISKLCVLNMWILAVY